MHENTRERSEITGERAGPSPPNVLLLVASRQIKNRGQKSLEGARPVRTVAVGVGLSILAGVLAFMALPAINLVNINLSRIYERASEIISPVGVPSSLVASA